MTDTSDLPDDTSSDAEDTSHVTDNETSPTTRIGSHGGMLIHISAQTFTMGCTAGQQGECSDNEYPAHEVSLNSFYISETEITQNEYTAIMGENLSEFLGCGLDCPVERINWHEAAPFLNALSLSEGLMACYSCSGEECEPSINPYDCNGYRLPTEAEWEAAARCGEDWMYVGGDDLDSVGWYYDNSPSITKAVRQKEPNACGVYDLSGNVWEWVHDWYGVYEDASVSAPTGPDSGANRIYRGGSYADFASYMRVTFRSYAEPSFRSNRLGFRLAISAP